MKINFNKANVTMSVSIFIVSIILVSVFFIQVKTVKMGVYEDYDKTNLFYLSLGFKELEVFPKLWDEANPCQIYIMSI